MAGLPSRCRTRVRREMRASSAILHPSLRGDSSMAAKKKAKRKPNAAFMKPVQPDATLAAVVGSSPMPRTELTKKIWGYIKRNGLQDKKNRRMINADDKLKAVFGGKASVNMFQMTALVAKHVK